MPMKSLQPSLSGGELAPALHARVDLVKYKTGLKTLLNWVIHPHGGVSNRPGLQFVSKLTASGQQHTRLVAFTASSFDTYILEFGLFYMRVIFRGDYVMSGGNPYQITTPYGIDQLAKLKFSQSNDVMTITAQNTPLMELSRLSHTNWTLAEVNWFPRVATPALAATQAIQGFTATGQGVITGQPYNPTQYYMATNYKYAITAIDARGEESLPSVQYDVINDLRWQPANLNRLTPAPHPTAVSFNIYRSDGDNAFGYVANIPVGNDFVDKNIVRQTADTWPNNKDPFANSKYPGTSGYYQQRRVFARGQTVFMTQSSNFYNFSVARPAKDSDSIEFTIAAKEIQEIRHIITMEDLLLFTSSGEWKVTGTKDEVITPSSILPKQQSAYGSSDLAPIVIGDQILFVQTKGNAVRDLGFKYDVNRYTGEDVSILARHLFKRRKIVDWAYAQTPDSIIWCVLDDGSLVSLTYMREHEVWGWARHKTQGRFKRVACIAEGEYDAAYFLVERLINGTWAHFVERMRPRSFRQIQDAFFVDCGLSYDQPLGPVTSVAAGSSTSITLANHGLSGDDQIEIETRTLGPYSDFALGGIYRLANVTANTFTLLNIDGSPVNTSGVDFAGTEIYVRRLISTVSGLGHLNGARVVGLADGEPIGIDEQLVVTNGSLTLPRPAARVHIGLGYTSDLESLELTQGDTNVTGRMKNVSLIRLRVEETVGLAVGPDFDSLQEAPVEMPIPVSTPPQPVTSDIEIKVEAGWSLFGRVCVRQRYPLPATVNALMPEIEYGG